MSLTREQWEAWLERLEDGTSNQANGALRSDTDPDTEEPYTDGRPGYCCLGLLCKELGYREGEHTSFLRFNHASGNDSYVSSLAPPEVIDENVQSVLATLNDGGTLTLYPNGPRVKVDKHTFAQIAEFLRAKGLDWINGHDGTLAGGRN